MQQDAHKWNRIFSKRTGPAPGPPEFLSRQHQGLKPGSVLDIASGDGANALFLAELGFAVTAVDVASAGLARLSEFASLRQLAILTKVIDLDDADAMALLKDYDNLVVSRFKPSTCTWPRLVNCLTPGGFLAITTFNINHHRSTGFRREFCLAPRELESIHNDLRLICHEGSECGDPSMDSYLFQRLPPK